MQDAWVRVSRLGAGEIDNLSGQNPACLSAESQQKIEGPQTTEDLFGQSQKENSQKFALTVLSEVCIV